MRYVKQEVCKVCGCTPPCRPHPVLLTARVADVLRAQVKADEPVADKCPECGKEIVRKVRAGQQPKFCSSTCRVRAWRKRP